MITAERAGFYKPRPEPYRAALAALGTRPERTLFVAGSASDVPGARGAGMPVFWHNRIGLPARDGAVPEYCERSLHRLPDVVLARAERRADAARHGPRFPCRHRTTGLDHRPRLCWKA